MHIIPEFMICNPKKYNKAGRADHQTILCRRRLDLSTNALVS